MQNKCWSYLPEISEKADSWLISEAGEDVLHGALPVFSADLPLSKTLRCDLWVDL